MTIDNLAEKVDECPSGSLCIVCVQLGVLKVSVICGRNSTGLSE